MKLIRTSIFTLLFSMILILFTSCPPPDESHPLDGTWTLAIEPNTLSGTMTLSYDSSDSGADVYNGTATIDGDDYILGVAEDTSSHIVAIIAMQMDDTYYVDYLQFAGMRSGSTISGTYSCLGDYGTGQSKEFNGGGGGTFTATK
jgi:hypothetical protein